MHLYWRLKEELKYLNETLVMKEPSMIREYNAWCKRNRLDQVQGEDKKPGIKVASNLFSHN